MGTKRSNANCVIVFVRFEEQFIVFLLGSHNITTTTTLIMIIGAMMN